MGEISEAARSWATSARGITTLALTIIGAIVGWSIAKHIEPSRRARLAHQAAMRRLRKDIAHDAR